MVGVTISGTGLTNGLVLGSGRGGTNGFWVFRGCVFLNGLMRILHTAAFCVVGICVSIGFLRVEENGGGVMKCKEACITTKLEIDRNERAAERMVE